MPARLVPGPLGDLSPAPVGERASRGNMYLTLVVSPRFPPFD